METKSIEQTSSLTRRIYLNGDTYSAENKDGSTIVLKDTYNPELTIELTEKLFKKISGDPSHPPRLIKHLLKKKGRYFETLQDKRSDLLKMVSDLEMDMKKRVPNPNDKILYEIFNETELARAWLVNHQ